MNQSSACEAVSGGWPMATRLFSYASPGGKQDKPCGSTHKNVGRNPIAPIKLFSRRNSPRPETSLGLPQVYSALRTLFKSTYSVMRKCCFARPRRAMPHRAPRNWGDCTLPYFISLGCGRYALSRRRNHSMCQSFSDSLYPKSEPSIHSRASLQPTFRAVFCKSK